ncbi:twin-arginine translocation pathway signal protein [Roseomonas sp. KE2513]|uniref:ABC transporter substrate-binding protein n=1 Tax=Roseomonas sp. KE2513 TaxID=2479202 RepID=UPI0018DF3EAB|nr:ABC transporter substrate-binding protein [Roseomonas sp. KE2513]MBI0536597.1 twin-arginine translocation pathway signal protein [Roseomonas sp. KE2513]
MTALSRRLVLAAPAALALPGPARAQAKPLRVAFLWIPNVEYAGLWVALDRGYIKPAELQWQPGGPNATAPVVTVAAGGADVGYVQLLPFLDAISRGNEFVLLAATFQRSPLGVISRGDKPIRAASDLPGKKILAQGPNERTAVDAVLKLNKLEGGVEFVPAGFSPEPLLARQGDGYTGFETNQVVTLERMGQTRGRDFDFVSMDSMGYRSYASMIFTTKAFLRSDRPAVVRFLAGLTRGWAENAADPAVAARLAVRNYGRDLGLDLDQQTRQNAIQNTFLKSPEKPDAPILSLDKEVLAGPMMEAARATGRTNLPAIEDFTDFTVMEEVHRTLANG